MQLTIKTSVCKLFVQSNLPLYSLYYSKACNEFAGPITHPRTTQLHSIKCRSGGKPLAKTTRNFNLRHPAPKTNALPFVQQAGVTFLYKILFHSKQRCTTDENFINSTFSLPNRPRLFQKTLATLTLQLQKVNMFAGAKAASLKFSEHPLCCILQTAPII